MKRLGFFTAVLCGMLLLATGCSMQRTFTYPMEPISVINPNPPKARIAVLPANDLRGTSNNWVTYMLYLVPLAPWGPVNFDRPESAVMFVTIGRFDSKIPEELSKAVAQHMKMAGVAQSVFFDYGGGTDKADYTLEIDLTKSQYHGRVLTYGLSVLGPLPWFVGFPVGTSEVLLTMNLKLKDRTGQTVWSQTVDQQWQVVQGMYYNMGRDMEGLARSLQSGLDETLRRHPMPINANVRQP